MEIVLERQYLPEATHGRFFVNDRKICYCIELPWVNNERRISCISEGRYQLEKRHSNKFGWHIYITDVPNRSFILIHPANCAVTQLKGCIAPVSRITGTGKGVFSKKANEALKFIVFEELAKDCNVFLNIVKAKEDGINQ